MQIKGFKKEHLLQLHERGVEYHMKEYIDENKLYLLEDETNYSILEDDKFVLVCFGMSKLWQGRGTVWAVFSEEGKKQVRKILPILRALMATNKDIRRFETPVPANDSKLHRWMAALGFSVETPLARKYYPDGSDASLYVMVKD